MEQLDQASTLRRMANQMDRGSTAVLERDMEHEKQPSHETPQRTKVLTVTSGKGGVGKTTVSVNLAISLARAGKKVLLFDGDLGLANINVLLGIIPEHNIYEVLKGKKKLQDIIIRTSYGIDIIAGANGISQLANLSDSQRENFLEGLQSLMGYDIMLIDTGAGVGANVIGLVLPADEILVVTTPEPTAITDAYGMIKSVVSHGPGGKIKLIVNRVPDAGEAKMVADRLISISNQFLKARVENLGFIFEESSVQKSIRSQRPYVVLFPNAKSSACIKHIAARLINAPVEEDSAGIYQFFQKMMNFSFRGKDD
ncbi:MAG: MinD/ParA family protein [Leptospirales bacterium]|jgi:flagellar biosynthesis protein FlhG|nr:MinD/ParA family protein [Leptospirales bacterium]